MDNYDIEQTLDNLTEQDNLIIGAVGELNDKVEVLDEKVNLIPFIKGEKGEEGKQGEIGEAGENGERGGKGEKGEKGDKGDRGDRGESIIGPMGKSSKGDKGDKGERGDIGLRGDRGDKGETGDKGDRGERGFNGERGESIIGPMGPIGLKGERGEDGKDGSPDIPKEIKNKLESLKGEERLDASAIKNLPISRQGRSIRGGGISSIVAGTNITVDNTDIFNPIINSTGGDASNRVLKAGDTMTGDLQMHADIVLRSGSRLVFDGS